MSSESRAKPPYGVLLIAGNRTHQENYAAIFAADSRCVLVAVADEADVPQTRAALNRRLAETYAIPYIPDLPTALGRPDIDLVSVCPEVERRARIIELCAKAGKQLYLDKPLAGSVPDARSIVAAIEQAGVRAQMCSHIHAHWAQAAKRAVEQAAVGRLLAVHAETLFAKGRAGSVPAGTTRREREEVGRYTFVEAKRELFDIGVYPVSLIRWITGARVEEVFGITANYFFAEHASADVEDFGALSLRMKGGITATVVAGRFGWTSHPASGPNRITLVGSDRTLTFDAYRPRLEVANDRPPFAMPGLHPDDPMGMWRSTQKASGVMEKAGWRAVADEQDAVAADIDAFLTCIEQQREPAMNPRAASDLVEVIVAGYRSAARGAPVSLHDGG